MVSAGSLVNGMSDSEIDQEIERRKRQLLGLEEGFFHKPSKEGAKALIKEWEDYRRLSLAYSEFPVKNLAIERICYYGDFIEDKINIDEIKSYLLANQKNNYLFRNNGFFITGDLEGVVFGSLKKKFGKEPGAFKLLVDEKGNMSPEKIDCKECLELILHDYCTSTDHCNCYNPEEYKKRRERMTRFGECLRYYEDNSSD